MKAVEKGQATIRHEERFSLIITKERSVYSYLPQEEREKMRLFLWDVRNFDRSGTVLLTDLCTKKETEWTQKKTQPVAKTIQEQQSTNFRTAQTNNGRTAGRLTRSCGQSSTSLNTQYHLFTSLRKANEDIRKRA